MHGLIAHSRTYEMNVTRDVADVFTVFGGGFGSGGDFSNWMKETDGVMEATLLRDKILVTIEPASDGPDLREEIVERLRAFVEADRDAIAGKGRDALPPTVRVEVEKSGKDDQDLLDRLIYFAGEDERSDLGWRWDLYAKFEVLPQFPPSMPLRPQLRATLREEMAEAGWGPAEAIAPVMDLIRTKRWVSKDEIEEGIRSALEAERVATAAPAP